MAATTTEQTKTNADESSHWTVTFKDVLGTELLTSQIVSLVMTLRVYMGGEIINSREDVDILNANGGTVADVTIDSVTMAQLTLYLEEEDNVITDDQLEEERHALLIKWTFNDAQSNLRTGRHRFLFDVVRDYRADTT